MTRFFVRVAVVLMVLFTVALVLIRAQPYDDSELRAFLMLPEGCAAPCFMGIRPGIRLDGMSVEEIIALLQAHKWVKTVNVDLFIQENQPPPNVAGAIAWEWSGFQPSLIDSSKDGYIPVGSSRSNSIS